MPKTQNKTMKSKKISKFSKKWFFVILGFVLIIGVVGYHYGSIYLEKREFERKRVELEKIADKIASQYPPDERKNEQYCQYSSQKFEKGERSCAVSTNLVYKVKNYDDANNFLQSISTNNTLGLLKNNLGNLKFSKNDWKSNDGYIYQTINILKNCSVNYRFNDESNIFESSYSCNSRAKAEYYPVKK